MNPRPPEPHTETAPVPPVAADLLGPYRLLGELGRGGMGVVYRAEDPGLRREVALKVLAPQLAADPLAKARFVREARSQAAVAHDHVAPIFHVGEADGVPFIAMPLLRGQALAAALKLNPRPPLAELVRIGREMADGLAAAHEVGLIHRDIKPANVWLEGTKRRVKILDFGLARLETPDPDATDGLTTADGAVMGTPAYMSPEQARGRPTDARTDLFSLGVVLYEMATGRRPFRGASSFDVMAAVASFHPPPAGEANPDVPAALSELIRRLMAKAATARPASAAAVATELEEIGRGLAGLPVQVYPLSAVPGAPNPWADIDTTETNPSAVTPAPAQSPRVSRRGFPARALAAGAVLAAGGLVGLVVQQRSKEPPAVEVAAEDARPNPRPGEKDRSRGEPAPGKGDFALRVDMTARGSVTVPSLTLPLKGPVTAEGYFSHTKQTVGHRVPIRWPGRFWISCLGGRWSLSFAASSGNYAIRDEALLKEDEKTHLAGVFDDEQGRFYVNGRLVGQVKFSPENPIKRELKGGLNIFDEFAGTADEVRISKAARYDKGFTPAKRFEPDADTLALYHCDEGQGDVLVDSSGNGHHGKISRPMWVRVTPDPIEPPKK